MSEESAPLAAVVRGEALRAHAESRIRSDPARIADGWERRFVVEARRVEEYVRLYESAGFEVAADPVRADQAEEACGDCRVVLALQFRVVYTRRKAGPEPD
ncbi:MAG TPA: hypothetical protein VF363_07055 [Candidatus Eisenbacteria bacterium]